MEPDTLRKMLKESPVEVLLNDGTAYVLKTPGTTIVSDFGFATLVETDRGLRTAYAAIGEISTATPVVEGA